MKKFDPQLDPDDVEAQYKRHKDLQKAGYYEENKTKSERANIAKTVGSGAVGSKVDLEKGMMGSSIPKPKLKAGGMIKSSASKRADGCCIKGKTKGKMV